MDILCQPAGFSATLSHLIKSAFLLAILGPNPVSFLWTSLDSQCAQLRCSWNSLKMPSIFLKMLLLIIFLCRDNLHPPLQAQTCLAESESIFRESNPT